MSIPLRLLAGAAVAAFGGAVLGTYRGEIAEIRRRVKAGGRMAQTRAGPIEYAVEGSGPPALVIHGAGGGYDQGLLLGRNFSGFQIVAPSRFGYLGTPPPAVISAAAQADAHAALLDSLGIDRAIVSGTSAGAPSAVELALRHPDRVRALILIVPRGYWPDQPEETRPPNEQVMRLVMSGADLAWVAGDAACPQQGSAVPGHAARGRGPGLPGGAGAGERDHEEHTAAQHAHRRHPQRGGHHVGAPAA